MKALAVNGSPRKNGHTAEVLKKSLEGAASEGCEIELIYLYGLNFKGCNGCNKCKLIGGEYYGRCAINDELTFVLKEIYEADILIMGSPVYLGTTTGEMRCFLERLIYPGLLSKPHKNIFTGLIYTMAATETQAKERQILEVLDRIEMQMKLAELETTEKLYVYNAVQFDDVSKYFSKINDPSHFEEFEEKAKMFQEERSPNFKKAFNMGARLAKLLQ